MTTLSVSSCLDNPGPRTTTSAHRIRFFRDPAAVAASVPSDVSSIGSTMTSRSFRCSSGFTEAGDARTTAPAPAFRADVAQSAAAPRNAREPAMTRTFPTEYCGQSVVVAGGTQGHRAAQRECRPWTRDQQRRRDSDIGDDNRAAGFAPLSNVLTDFPQPHRDCRCAVTADRPPRHCWHFTPVGMSTEAT